MIVSHSSCALLFELVHDHKGADEAYKSFLLIVLVDAHGRQSHGHLGSNLLLSTILKAVIAILLEDAINSLDFGATMRVKHVLPLLLVETDTFHLDLRHGCRLRLRLPQLRCVRRLEWIVARWMHIAGRLRIRHIVHLRHLVAIVIISQVEEVVVVTVLIYLSLLSRSVTKQLVHVNLLVAVLIEHRLVTIRLHHLLRVVSLQLARQMS